MCIAKKYCSLMLLWVSISIFLCGASGTQKNAGGYSHTVYINASILWEDTPSCLTSNDPSSPCCNLTWVFLQDNLRNSTEYVLSEGVHSLTASSSFKDLVSLAFTGVGSMVTCSGVDTGLSFVNVVDIAFYNVSFVNCAAIRNSTSKNFIENVISPFKVGLYFYFCEAVNMSHVQVINSPHATGVVMYDTNGTNTISHSTFSNNTVTDLDKDYPGGGGFYVEFTYCEPGILSCDEPTSERNRGALYIFSSCIFSYNRADNLDTEDRSTYIFPYKANHQALGRGGGLSLFIRGNTTCVRFMISDCSFFDNYASWGGGLFIELHDNAYSNNISVENTTFHNNSCPFTLTTGTGGGGMRLGHYVYGFDGPLPVSALKNGFIIKNCTFVNNSALNGAGISLSWAPQNTTTTYKVADFDISDSYFESNVARLGAAIHVVRFWMVYGGLPVRINIRNSVFHKNTDQYYFRVQNGSSNSILTGLGAVYVASSDVWFQGEINFTSTHGSALGVSDGVVHFEGCDALFKGGWASRGAGILLLGASTINLGRETRMVFEDNQSKTKGGAIYSISISREYLKSDPNCFVRYEDPTTHPDNWNVSVTFINNTGDSAQTPFSAIYSTSLLPCSVVGGSGVVYNTTHVLCWQGWFYYNQTTDTGPVDCDSQLSSDVGNLTRTGSNGDHVQAIPGWDFEMPISVLDDLGEDIHSSTVFTLRKRNSTATKIIRGTNTSLVGLENSNLHVSLETYGERTWYINFSVELQNCPPGFTSKNLTCMCAQDFDGLVSCDDKSKEATIDINIWIGFVDDNETYYAGLCAAGYCNQYAHSYVLPTNYETLKETICSPHRTGVMCGECDEGYGPAVNSPTYDCANCTDSDFAKNLAKYIASVYLPLGVLFSLLIMFDIRLTTGPANAFILYAQVISSTFSLDAGGVIPLYKFTNRYKMVLKAYKFPYGVFNLEFVENYITLFCVSSRMNTLSVLFLDYIVALFPLLIIIIVILSLKIKDCCHFSIRRGSSSTHPSQNILSRISGRKKGINEALLPAFAAFMLLSYNKFCSVSTYIVTFMSLYNENGTSHNSRVQLAGQYSLNDKEYIYRYLIPTVIVYFTFVLITPLLLLDYPLRAFEWVVSKSKYLRKIYPVAKVHILLDTFQGCYRDNMRFFAGTYFVFRLVINLSYIYFDLWIAQFMFQQIACSVMIALIALCQPYKRKWLNYVDILIFLNLAIMNSISLYLTSFFQLNHRKKTGEVFLFSTQSILVFFPLIYMLVYIFLYRMQVYEGPLRRKYRSCLQALTKCFNVKPRYTQLNGVVEDDDSSTDFIPVRSPPVDETIHTEPKDEMDAFFERAESANSYQSNLPVTVVGFARDGSNGEATVHQTYSDSSVKSTPTQSGSGYYGSTDASRSHSGGDGGGGDGGGGGGGGVVFDFGTRSDIYGKN